jgi:hypothetical protein
MTEEQDTPLRNLARRRNLRVVLPSVAVIGIMLGLSDIRCPGHPRMNSTGACMTI